MWYLGLYDNSEHNTLLIVHRKLPQLPLLGPQYHLLKSIPELKFFSVFLLGMSSGFSPWWRCGQDSQLSFSTAFPHLHQLLKLLMFNCLNISIQKQDNGQWITLSLFSATSPSWLGGVRMPKGVPPNRSIGSWVSVLAASCLLNFCLFCRKASCSIVSSFCRSCFDLGRDNHISSFVVCFGMIGQ